MEGAVKTPVKAPEKQGCLAGFSYRYTHCLYKCRLVIPIVWVAVALAFAYFALSYIPHSKLEFVPPPPSDGAEAHKVMNELFPSIEHSGINLVYIETPDGSPITLYGDQDNNETHKKLKIFTDSIHEELEQYSFILENGIIGITDIEAAVEEEAQKFKQECEEEPIKCRFIFDMIDDFVYDVEDYLSYIFYSEDKTATFIVVQANLTDDTYSTSALMTAMEDAIEVAREKSFGDTYTPAPIGMDIILQLVTDSTMDDLLLMDVTVIPIAFVIFAIFLKSVRLLLIPIIQLLISLSVSFGISYFMTLSMSVPPFASSIQSAFCLAMTVDYCLFLMSSFRKGISVGLPVVPAVRYMIGSAGKVVVISCLSVTLSVSSLMLYNIDLIRICGYGTVITLLTLLMVCLTFVPCVIMLFPNFFSKFSFNKNQKVSIFYTKEELGEDMLEGYNSNGDKNSSEVSGLDSKHLSHLSSSNVENNNNNNARKNEVDSSTSSSSDRMKDEIMETDDMGLLTGNTKNKTCTDKYHEFTRWISTYPKVVVNAFTKTRWISVIVVVGSLLVAAPFIYLSLIQDPSLDVNLDIPQGNNIVKMTNEFTSKFTPGLAFQSYLIVTPSEDVNVDEVNLFSNVTFKGLSQAAKDLSLELETQEVNEDGTLSPKLLKYRNYLSLDNIPGFYTNVTSEDNPNKEREPYILDWDFVNVCINDRFPGLYDRFVCSLYRQYAAALLGTSEEQITSQKSIPVFYISEIGIDGVGATDLVDKMRGFVAEEELLNLGFNGYVWGIIGDLVDCERFSMHWFPIITIIIVIIVFIIMSLAYKSLFTVLRLILSIIITLSVGFGTTVLVYQIILDYGIMWAVLPFGFCIMIGLSCDYDSFIYSYFKDFRNMGFTEQGAIRKAVAEVTPIVNSAGLIMAVSFVGLIISHIIMLNQFGVLLLVGVLVETFWNRPFFVSSFINICRRLVHWPFFKSLPPEQFDETVEAATDYGKKFTSEGWVSKGKSEESKNLVSEKIGTSDKSSSSDSSNTSSSSDEI